MVSDQEPRYRLVDADGNVVGSLFAESDGTLKLQEGTSGNDRETSFASSGTFSAPAVNTTEFQFANTTLYEQDSFIFGTAGTQVGQFSSTTSNSYVTVSDGSGVVSFEDTPTAATPYGRVLARMSNDTSNETTFLRPTLLDTDVNEFGLNELEVSVTDTVNTFVDSGWVEITTPPLDDIYLMNKLQGKVSGGTGDYLDGQVGVLFAWRLEN